MVATSGAGWTVEWAGPGAHNDYLLFATVYYILLSTICYCLLSTNVFCFLLSSIYYCLLLSTTVTSGQLMMDATSCEGWALGSEVAWARGPGGLPVVSTIHLLPTLHYCTV